MSKQQVVYTPEEINDHVEGLTDRLYIDPAVIAKWFTLTADHTEYGCGVAEFGCCF